MDFQSMINSSKTRIFAAIVAVVVVAVIVLFRSLVATVESGTYHIKQAAVTGTLTAEMSPGMYWLAFGSNELWPKSETLFFTDDKDVDEDTHDDLSIRAQFNDGSIVWISGTARIILPTDEKDATNVVHVYGYRTYQSLRDKHILPILRKAVRNTASLMSAQESYATKRTDFQTWAADQLEKGMYKLLDKTRRVKVDEGCIDTAKKPCELKDERYKVIAKNPDNTYITEKNALIPGAKVLNFEVKKFRYDKKVKLQIASQQESMMMVQTAITDTKKAEQERIKAEALGKKAVMEAKYAEEELKIQAVVRAEKEKEVAELQGEKRKNVAELDRDAAKFYKEEQRLRGEGEAARKKLVMQADGALQQKLEAWTKAQQYWADAYQHRQVPTYVSGGDSSSVNTDASDFQNMMNLIMAKQLGIDMNIKK
jgi:regulator of protease activity HflC (stomatin/prohibitin superfamily)